MNFMRRSQNNEEIDSLFQSKEHSLERDVAELENISLGLSQESLNTTLINDGGPPKTAVLTTKDLKTEIFPIKEATEEQTPYEPITIKAFTKSQRYWLNEQDLNKQ